MMLKTFLFYTLDLQLFTGYYHLNSDKALTIYCSIAYGINDE